MATKRRLCYEGSDGLESLLPENFFRLSAHRRHFYTAEIPSSKGTKHCFIYSDSLSKTKDKHCNFRLFKLYCTSSFSLSRTFIRLCSFSALLFCLSRSSLAYKLNKQKSMGETWYGIKMRVSAKHWILSLLKR